MTLNDHDIETLERVSKGLNNIGLFEFIDILKPYYNEDYCKDVYIQFTYDPLGFCLSRNPIEPGHAILKFAYL